MDYDEIRKTHIVYKEEYDQDINMGDENFLDNAEDPLFDRTYVAKLLSYHDNTQPSNFVGLISYKNQKEPRSILCYFILI